MYIPFLASFIKQGSRPMLPIRRLPEMITGCQRSSRPAGLFAIERYERLILLLLAAGLLGLSDLLCIVDNLLQ